MITIKYYAQYQNEKLIAISTGLDGTEITKEEYDRLLSEIREKAVLVDKLYNEEITISDVPTEWQEEIQRRVNERIEQMGKLEEQPISAEQAVSIILGGEI